MYPSHVNSRTAKFITILLLVMGVMSSSYPISAAGYFPHDGPRKGKDIPKEVQEQRELQHRYLKGIKALEKHLAKENGQLVLKVKKGADVGIDEQLFAELSDSMEEANKQIRDGKVRLDDVRLVTDDPSMEPRGSNFFSCDGWTGVRWYWWGYRVYLNSCHTNALAGVLAIGGGVAGLCALIPTYLVPCGVLAGVTAISAGTIQIINAWGGDRGIYINFSWGGRVQSLWHQ